MKYSNRAEGNMINHEGIIMACEYIEQYKKSLSILKVRDNISFEDNDRVTNVLNSLKKDLTQLSNVLYASKGLVKNKASDEKRDLVTNMVYKLQGDFNSLKQDANLFIQFSSSKELDINKLSSPLVQAGLRIDFNKKHRSDLSFADREAEREQQGKSSGRGSSL